MQANKPASKPPFPGRSSQDFGAKQERAERIKYLRALDGALIKITKCVKREAFCPEQFAATAAQIVKSFAKIKRQTLDSEYSKNLEKFINACCFEHLSKEQILSELNALDKLRRQRRYKKDKHKNKIFEE